MPSTPVVDQAAAPLSALLVERPDRGGLGFVHRHGGEGHRELPETMGAGAAAIDYDQDGDQDLFLVQSGPLSHAAGSDGGPAGADELWRNDGRAHFEAVPHAAGAADPGYGQGVCVGDIDGDGRDELYTLNWGANRLHYNLGGAFEDRTQALGLSDGDRWSVSGAFLDFDSDGDLDLYVVNYLESPPDSHLDPRINARAPLGYQAYPHPDRFRAQPSALYRNDGARFVDSSQEAGLAVPPGKGLGVVATDIDLDGWIDLYQANDSTPNFLFHNLGGRFEELGASSATAFNDNGRTEAGMGVDSADVDLDGDLDLFVTNLDMETNTLYLNRSIEVDRNGLTKHAPLCFRDRTSASGLAEPSRLLVGFGTLFADLDRDGDQDLLVANGHIIDNVGLVSDNRTHAQPAQLFLNDGSGRFRLAEPALAPGLSTPRVARGLLQADFDGDLAPDFLISCNNSTPALFCGTPPEREYLYLRLEGPPGNPKGLGASIWLELEQGARVLGHIESARAYGSSSEAAWHIGLCSPVRAVELLWPGGKRERYEALNRFRGEQRLVFGRGRAL